MSRLNIENVYVARCRPIISLTAPSPATLVTSHSYCYQNRNFLVADSIEMSGFDRCAILQALNTWCCPHTLVSFRAETSTICPNCMLLLVQYMTFAARAPLLFFGSTRSISGIYQPIFPGSRSSLTHNFICLNVAACRRLRFVNSLL